MTYQPNAAPPAPASAIGKPPPAAEPHKNPVRETAETIVFVVFLVVLLRAFIAEAFAIPSGSMATTLEGNHRMVRCVACGHEFATNADMEAERDLRAICPNCQCDQPLANTSGDWLYPLRGGVKVLVFKSPAGYEPLDVIVFKFPGKPVDWPAKPGDDKPQRGYDEGPQHNYSAKNYIKRLWGMPGEKLKIWYGDVYVYGRNGVEEWRIIRKPPDKMLDMRRLVFDNDHQPAEWGAEQRRWRDAEGDAGRWRAAENHRTFEIEGDRAWHWLEYNHLPVLEGWTKDEKPPSVPPQLVIDMLGYNNTFENPNREKSFQQPRNWVGDLMLECEVEVTAAEGQVVLELREGVDACQAVFDPATGRCVLKVVREGQEIKSAEAATGLRGAGKHQVRFANFDDRLTLWVNGRLPFGAGLEYDIPEEKRGPRLADVRPAAIGVQGASLRVRHLKLWRDIYYTREHNAASDTVLLAGGRPSDALGLTPAMEAELIDPDLPLAERRKLAHSRVKPAWDPYQPGALFERRMGPPEVYPRPTPDRPDARLGPDEYFALGDNPTHSSDSRDWMAVPERLLLGKAVFVYWYWPLTWSRLGLIR